MAHSLRIAGIVVVMASAAAAACSSTSSSPMGGPYGGASFNVKPTDAGNVDPRDATFTPPSPPAAGPQGAYGTWTHIFTSYMAKNTFGKCTNCHPKEMPDGMKSYKWLKDQDYIGGAHPELTGRNSCLSWYGGDMPPGKQPPLDEAVKEMDMWAAAGGKNN